MPVVSPEAARDVARRDEERKQQILDAIKTGAMPSTSAGTNCEGVNRALDSSPQQEKEKDGKENTSPFNAAAFRRYPAKPARSVYNSPLIAKNQEHVWKNAPLFASDIDSSSVKRDDSLLIPNTYAYFRQPSSLLSNKTSANMSVRRLYPSIPRTATGIIPLLESQAEEDSEKETQFYSPAGSDEFHSFPVTSSPESPKTNAKIPLASSTFVEDKCSNSPTHVNIESFKNDTKNQFSPEHSVHSNSPTEDDIENTFEMDQFLEEAFSVQLDTSSSAESVVSSFVRGDSVYTLCCCKNLKRSAPSDSLSFASTKCVSLPIPPNEAQNDRVERLLIEAERQQQIEMQASKALVVCRSRKEFSNSMHLVDGERVLLIASLRHQAVLKEIQMTPTESEPEFRGDLQIMDIVAPLKLDQAIATKSGLYCQWFLCVVSYREQVIATKAVARESEADCVRFSDILYLTNLPPSFTATVQIYMLQLKVPRKLSKPYGLNRVRNILGVPKKSCVGLVSSSNSVLFLRTPAFSLSGTATLSLRNADQLSIVHLSLEKVPLMSPLRGSVSMQLRASVQNTMEISGFLDKLEERKGCRAWQRRWCHLSGLKLRFWNYPSDQDDKIPLEVIELRTCMSNEVNLAPRALCARARTIMLETRRAQSSQDLNSTLLECVPGYTIERHFIACDSTASLNDWMRALNQNLLAILTWKIPHL